MVVVIEADVIVDGETELDHAVDAAAEGVGLLEGCLLYTSPSPRDATLSRMPSSA